MMKKSLLTLLLLPFSVMSELRYLPAHDPVVPEGSVVALEVRAALSDARPGAGRKASWSFAWGDSVTVSLTFDFRSFVDGVSEPAVTLSCAGRTAQVINGFNCGGGFNTLAVEWGADGRVTLLGGERELQPLLELDSLPRPQGRLRITPEADVADVIVELNPDDFARLQTGYTAMQLDSATVWRYLDRENDPAVALPGGRYMLAQVGNDLVYLAGAQTNASRWRRGMLKGRLTPTGYVGYYLLEWFDATGRRIAEDCFAQFDSAASTLTLTFPALQASLRFSKLPVRE